jgi:hypothetical protein
MKRARRSEPAVRATISQFLDAILSKKGASLIRSKEHVVFLNDDEMDRLAGEWLAFRAAPEVEHE